MVTQLQPIGLCNVTYKVITKATVIDVPMEGQQESLDHDHPKGPSNQEIKAKTQLVKGDQTVRLSGSVKKLSLIHI